MLVSTDHPMGLFLGVVIGGPRLRQLERHQEVLDDCFAMQFLQIHSRTHTKAAEKPCSHAASRRSVVPHPNPWLSRKA